MTVRAWFTISALVVVALAVAVTVRLLSPLQPPELIARSADQRLPGVHERSCWPQRGGDLRCVSPQTPDRPEGPEVPAEGSLRVVAAYPIQPEEGTLLIRDEEAGAVVAESSWTDRWPYQLDPGAYRLEAEARYSEDAFVRYSFPFTVRR